MKKRFCEIFSPEDLKLLQLGDLTDFAHFLRNELIGNVEKTGGHLGSGLGVIELSIALHYVFDAPKDKIIWDTGHQSYPHKMLTNRRSLMHSMRQFGGLSGFTKISESEYDAFGAGHSSSSISVASAFVQSRKHKNQSFDVIAVIGDGAVSAGLAYEGLNNLGCTKEKSLVILNDNKLSIDKSVGAIQHHINSITDLGVIRLSNHKELLKILEIGIEDDGQIYNMLSIDILQELDNLIRKCRHNHSNNNININDNNLFSNLGFRYVGPICGHDVVGLSLLLRHIKRIQCMYPILLHIVTNKGQGYIDNKNQDSISSNSFSGYHSISKDVSTILLHKHKTKSFTEACIDAMNIIASNDDGVVAVTAAMLSGTGLKKFLFQDRVFDVGIAEQHAVVFSAGIALEGLNVFCFIYSTFLQRAYDQVINEVAIQNLPVKFILDRAGVVGPDGETHTGYFDLSFLNSIPNFVILVPSSVIEVGLMTNFLYKHNASPIAMRIPKLDEVLEDSVDIATEKHLPIELGKSRVVIEDGYDILFLCIGHCVKDVLELRGMLNEFNTYITIVDMRFVKPVDEKLVYYYTIEKGISNIVVVEHGMSTGIGRSILALLNKIYSSHLYNGDSNLKKFAFEHICFPDKFIQHGDFDSIYNMLELNSQGIFNRIKHFCKLYQE